MNIKTREEILESHHNSALAKLLEDEVNLRALKKRQKEMKPGKAYEKIQLTIDAKKTNLERVTLVLKIIKEMIEEETMVKKGKQNGGKKV